LSLPQQEVINTWLNWFIRLIIWFLLLALLIGSLSLVGFPETSGFYSKEAILNYLTLS
jgi:NADH:ubiquinone oxidoreductase subunit 5 (subunit L)/multisubunit Na+/H+ antiporter MnhA subunit